MEFMLAYFCSWAQTAKIKSEKFVIIIFSRNEFLRFPSTATYIGNTIVECNHPKNFPTKISGYTVLATCNYCLRYVTECVGVREV